MTACPAAGCWGEIWDLSLKTCPATKGLLHAKDAPLCLVALRGFEAAAENSQHPL